MCWDEHLIDRYIQKIDKERLINNPGVCWTKNMLNVLSDWLNQRTLNYDNGWGCIARADGKWKTLEILTEFNDKIAWKFLSTNTNIDWRAILRTSLSEYFFRTYYSYNTVYVGLMGIASNPSFPWTEELLSEKTSIIENNKDFWGYFNSNYGLKKDISIVRKFSQYLSFKHLSYNDSVVWSEELLSEFIDHPWDWSSLSKSTTLPWSDELLSSGKDFNWECIANNEGVFKRIIQPRINPLFINEIMNME
ncbi:hypothetical protein [Desertivirga xinjiangensis]|uniref:hypothetical protein n=1 Tax=Desertivirga xinjiangensis TaxID=539206 RepID=UPI00210A601F|nr:hypothetical protein [Pedobacter xinjiangensis]